MEEINEQPELLERVCEVLVFGGYLEAREHFRELAHALRVGL